MESSDKDLGPPFSGSDETANVKMLRQEKSSFLLAGVSHCFHLYVQVNVLAWKKPIINIFSIQPGCPNTAQCLTRRPWSVGLFTMKDHGMFSPRWKLNPLCSVFFFFLSSALIMAFRPQQPSLVWAQTPLQNFLSSRNEETGVPEFFSSFSSWIPEPEIAGD